MDYRKYINTIIKKNKRILEIGPLNRVIISKKDYPNIFYADIRNTNEIKKLYTSNQYLEETKIKVDVDSIVDIDFVIKGSYEKTFKDVEKFDYVVASHVLEHIPDIIYFLQDIRKILKPDGKLIIIYPDKRYCFDHFRTDSSFRDAYEIFVSEDKSNPKMVFDFMFNVVNENNPVYFWKADNIIEKNNNDRFEKAKIAYDKTLSGSGNDDIHYWPFSDYGFLKFLSDLNISNLISYELLEFYKTERDTQEFLVILKSCGKKKNESFYNAIKKIDPNYILAELYQKNENYNNIILEKEAHINYLKNSINNIYNSSSWKITKPIRIFKNLISNVFRKGK